MEEAKTQKTPLLNQIKSEYKEQGTQLLIKIVPALMMMAKKRLLLKLAH